MQGASEETDRGAFVVGGVDAGAGLEEQLAGGLVARHDGVVEGMAAAVALEVDVGPAVEEQLDHVALARRFDSATNAIGAGALFRLV